MRSRVGNADRCYQLRSFVLIILSCFALSWPHAYRPKIQQESQGRLSGNGVMYKQMAKVISEILNT